MTRYYKTPACVPATTRWSKSNHPPATNDATQPSPPSTRDTCRERSRVRVAFLAPVFVLSLHSHRMLAPGISNPPLFSPVYIQITVKRCAPRQQINVHREIQFNSARFDSLPFSSSTEDRPSRGRKTWLRENSFASRR